MWKQDMEDGLRYATDQYNAIYAHNCNGQIATQIKDLKYYIKPGCKLGDC